MAIGKHDSRFGTTNLLKYPTLNFPHHNTPIPYSARMRVSHKSILTISLIWGGACLTQVSCVPISPTSESGIQFVMQLDEIPQLVVTTTSPNSNSHSPETTEIEISAGASPSRTNRDGTMTRTNDHGDNDLDDDDEDMGRSRFLEYLKWLRSSSVWFVTSMVQQVLPFALFCGACVGTFFGVLMVSIWLAELVAVLPALLLPFLGICVLVGGKLAPLIFRRRSNVQAGHC